MSASVPGAPERLVHGSIARSLLRLAWPVFLTRAMHTLYGAWDTMWVGRLGPDAIAAVSTSFFASWSLHAVGTMFIAGVTAVVSQSIGAGRDEEAASTVATGLVLSVVIGVAVAAGGWFGAAPLFRLLFDNPNVVELGATYLSVISLMAPIVYPVVVIESMYRSCGDSRTPMLVVLVGTLLNIVLDPLLILGVGPFPELGVLGAALATVAGETATLTVALVLWARGSFPLALSGTDGRSWFSRLRGRQILTIGAPEALIEIFFSAVYLVLARITGSFGAAATAALGIVNRMEAITYLTSAAIGMAVATLVGQNLGAAQPERAEASARAGAVAVTVLASVLTLAFLALPGPIVRIFTDDPMAIAQGVVFLRIVAVSQVFMGWELVYGHAFVGAGDTLPPMYVSVVTSAIRVPLAWWLAFHTSWGTLGIWWAISATCILRGIVLALWFRRGRWKTKDLELGPRLPVEAVARFPDSPET